MPLLGPPRHPFGIIVVVVAVLLVALFSLLGWTAEWLWMRELGYATVFWRLRGLQIAIVPRHAADRRALFRSRSTLPRSDHAANRGRWPCRPLRSVGLGDAAHRRHPGTDHRRDPCRDLFRRLVGRPAARPFRARFRAGRPGLRTRHRFYVFLLPILEKNPEPGGGNDRRRHPDSSDGPSQSGPFSCMAESGRADATCRPGRNRGQRRGFRRRLGVRLSARPVQPAIRQQRRGVRFPATRTSRW